MAEVLGYGTKLEVNTTPTSTATWVAVFAELIDLEPPEDQIKPIDSTHFNSANQTKTSVPGWVEPGKLKASGHYNAAELATILTWARTPQIFRIVFNDPSNATPALYSGLTFTGYLLSNPVKAPIDGIDATTINIQCTTASVQITPTSTP